MDKRGRGEPDAEREEELADRYESLMLHGEQVPEKLLAAMQQAYLRVHLRGLDPVRNKG